MPADTQGRAASSHFALFERELNTQWIAFRNNSAKMPHLLVLLCPVCMLPWVCVAIRALLGGSDGSCYHWTGYARGQAVQDGTALLSMPGTDF